MQASVDRSAFYQQMVTLFDRFDFLALPTAQVWPFPVEWRWPKEIAGRTMDTYHRWMEVVTSATFAGLPCVSVPVGFNAAGLPMGMQLIGRPRGDMKLLRLARDYERVAADVLAVRPGGVTPAAARGGRYHRRSMSTAHPHSRPAPAALARADAGARRGARRDDAAADRSRRRARAGPGRRLRVGA